MDINRQISAEKYVDVCIESFVFVFWNVHNEGPLYLLLNNARIIYQILCRAMIIISMAHLLRRRRFVRDMH